MVVTRHRICQISPKILRKTIMRSLLPNPWIARDHELKCCYIHVPRTGGTSLSTALYGRDRGHQSLDHYAAFGKRFISNYFKFGIVRNPWDRLVSSFHQLNKPTGGARLMRYWSEMGISTFDELVFALEDPKSRVMLWRMPHLRSQSYYLISDFTSLDYIGRFEELSQSLSYISKRICLPLKIAHLNSTIRRPYQEYYTNETRDLVGSIYQDDIVNFDYQF